MALVCWTHLAFISLFLLFKKNSKFYYLLSARVLKISAVKIFKKLWEQQKGNFLSPKASLSATHCSHPPVSSQVWPRQVRLEFVIQNYKLEFVWRSQPHEELRKSPFSPFLFDHLLLVPHFTPWAVFINSQESGLTAVCSIRKFQGQKSGFFHPLHMTASRHHGSAPVWAQTDYRSSLMEDRVAGKGVGRDALKWEMTSVVP